MSKIHIKVIRAGSSSTAAAWTTSGGSIVTGTLCALHLWQFDSEMPVTIATDNPITAVALLSDGSRIASGEDSGVIRLWDAISGQRMATVRGHAGQILNLAWSPNRKLLASGSADGTVKLWDVSFGREVRTFFDQQSNHVYCVAWSPNGERLASASGDSTVALWDVATGAQLNRLAGHLRSVRCVAWSSSGTILASGSDDRTIRLWDTKTGKSKLALEGHHSAVKFLAWSTDDSVLASADHDGEIRLWESSTGKLLDRRSPPDGQEKATIGIAFRLGVRVGKGASFDIDVWSASLSNKEAPSQVFQVSAKVILSGDSNAGKTCLARRLSEDRFEFGQETTHGMRVWTIPAERLHEDGAAAVGQNREIFLWDLGGQNEYQLVNQLFLQDSTVALVIFDGGRGNIGLESAKAWNHRLQTPANASLRKLLVRSKADQLGVVVAADVESVRRSLGFSKYIEVSAKRDDDEGIIELREALHQAIDWPSLMITSRPLAFQEIRDYLTEARESGEVVIYFTDLQRELPKRGIECNSAELETTLSHLARGGQIVDIELQSGDRVLVLRVEVLSRYAGSLVQAARLNIRGVPILEQNVILSSQMAFPGLKPDERLTSRLQEKMILECAARLMIERGICFDHQGLLIFPTLFDDLAPREGTVSSSAPIYYDFNGPIDNIYAALVARLTISEKFGPVRLWANYAEFGERHGEILGLHRDPASGRGHLDLYSDRSTDEDLRKLFHNFINDYLINEGVAVLSGLGFVCKKCKNKFSEENIRARLAANKNEIACQQCDSTYSLFAGADVPSPENRKDLIALKTDVVQKTRAAEQKVAATMARILVMSQHEPLRILHLSDLHFTGETRYDSVLQPIEADLKNKLKINLLDYIVVSGDFSDKCNADGFVFAREFLQGLAAAFEVNPMRVILIPGNHDLEHNTENFSIQNWRPDGKYHDGHREGSIVLIPNDSYVQRFDSFRRFYHSFYTTQEYPVDPSRQFQVIPDPSGIQFLCLNSAWKIDQFRPERAVLNEEALSAGLRKSGNVRLGILVWHHALAGDRKVADTEAIERLAEAGFHLLLHGDVHEHRDVLLNHLDAGRRIHVIGGGAFGASSSDRPESTPRLYSLLEVDRNLKSIRVMRRRQKTANGSYDAYAIYPGPDTNTKKSEYTIDLP